MKPLTPMKSFIIIGLCAWFAGAVNVSNLYPRVFNLPSEQQEYLLSVLPWIYPHVKVVAQDNQTDTNPTTTSISPNPIIEPTQSGPEIKAQQVSPNLPQSTNNDTLVKKESSSTYSIDKEPNTNTPNPSHTPTKTTASTPESPVKLMTIGDSMTNGYAMGIAQLKVPHDIPAKVHLLDLAKHSTGLVNFKYFNWPKEFEKLCQIHKPQWVMASFGSNDLMGIYESGKTLPFGSNDWQSVYEKRGSAILNIANSCGAKVIWVIPPIVRKPDHEQMMKTVRLAQLNNCKNSDVCVQADELLSPDGKRYDDFLIINNQKTLVRASDGVHLTMQGYKMVAKKALDQVFRGQPLTQK